jgi:hypothetical protein
MNKPITLRVVISEYSKWIAAIWGASARQQIMPADAWHMIAELQSEMRRWIGAELLNKEL